MSLMSVVYRVAGEEPDRLFVYGSLMQDGEAHDQLAGAKFIGPVETAPRYQMMELGDDFVAITDGDQCIAGELYELNHSILDRIDDWEYDVYSRKPIELADGSWAQTYML